MAEPTKPPATGATPPTVAQPMRSLRAIYYQSLDEAVLEAGEQKAPVRVFPLKVPATLVPYDIAKMFVKQMADKWQQIGFKRAGRRGDLLFLDAEDIPADQSMYIVDDRVLPLDPRFNMRKWYETPMSDKIRGYRWCTSKKFYLFDEKMPGDEGYVAPDAEMSQAIDQFVDDRAKATQDVIDKATGRDRTKAVYADRIDARPEPSPVVTPKRDTTIIVPDAAKPTSGGIIKPPDYQ